MFFLLVGASVIVYFYMLIRISKTSMLMAIGCFFIGPLILLALFLYWNNEESDIKVPFFILVVLAVLTAMVGKPLSHIEGTLQLLQLAA